MEPEPAPRPLPGCRLPAVVVNPSNLNDLTQIRTQIARVCRELGWAEPLWLETSVEDPGEGQAEAALAAGADVVLACGGDGTIRHVAQVLAGSGTALGLLPTGTANLLARNLAVPLDDTAGATRIALSGDSRPIDIGRVTFDDRTEETVFLVMAGMGFDAAIMAGAHEGPAGLAGVLHRRNARAAQAAGQDRPRCGRSARAAPSGPDGGGRQLRQAARRAGADACGQSGRRVAGRGGHRAKEHPGMAGGDGAGAEPTS